MKAGTLIMLAALEGCVHRTVPTPQHATASAAQPLVVDWRESSAAYPVTRGRHTASSRGDGTTDWYLFEIDRACRSVTIGFANPGSTLEVRVVRPDGTLSSTRVDESAHPRKGARLPTTDAITLENAALGHYYLGVAAVAGAAPYRVLVHDATKGLECGDLPAPMPQETHRPAAALQLPAPAGMIAARVDAWLGYPHDRHVGYVADLAVGFDDGVRHTTGVVLDDRGQPIPGLELRVEADDAHHARGELIGSEDLVPASWSVALRPAALPRPPLTARVTDRWIRDGAVYVAFDRGSTDGVAVGWRGIAAGIALEVVEVHGIRGVARIDGTTLDAVLALTGVQLGP